MSDPWFAALAVCATAPMSEAVLRELRRRGWRARGVPTGPARGAWSCALPPQDSTRGGHALVGVVLTGAGLPAARQTAASFAPRAGAILITGTGPGSGLVAPGSVVFDGDPGLLAAARAGAPEGVVGRVATVTNPAEGMAARQSLAGIGVAATNQLAASWRDVAGPARIPLLVIQGVGPPGADPNQDIPVAVGPEALRPGEVRPGFRTRLLEPRRYAAWQSAVAGASAVRARVAAAAVEALVHSAAR